MYIKHGKNLIEHHTHYLELHGYDKTVFMSKSKHQILHHRLRKSGKCDIPVKDLERISSIAYKRNHKEKRIKDNAVYRANHKENATQYRGSHKEKNIKYQQKYRLAHKKEIALYNQKILWYKSLHSITNMGINIEIFLQYNLKTHHITFGNRIRKSGGR